jgi:hypothetical protein
MAHVQKPDLIFLRNGQIPFKSAGASVQSTTGRRGVRISSSNAGYTTFCGSVKDTGYPLHSPTTPSLPHPCVVYHHVSIGLYHGVMSQNTANFTGNTTRTPSFTEKSPFIVTGSDYRIHCHHSETLIISESDQVLYSVTGHSKLPQASLYTEGTGCCCFPALQLGI